MPAHVSHLKLTQNPQAKRVLESAANKATQLGHRYLGVEHIALGLVDEESGIFADVLNDLGWSRESLRVAIIGRIAEPTPPPELEHSVS